MTIKRAMIPQLGHVKCINTEPLISKCTNINEPTKLGIPK